MKCTLLIGAARPQKLPALVCEHSIRRYASVSIDIIHTFDEQAPEPRKKEHRSRTGFSFQRFTLPKRAGYEGLGVYLDSDMIVLDDVAELFGSIPGEMSIACTKNLPSVFAVRCDRVHWIANNFLIALDAGMLSYARLMMLDVFGEFLSKTIPNSWNALDECPPGTKLVHYTNMLKQCWLTNQKHRPVDDIWKAELRAALKDGSITMETVTEEIRLGHVVPECVQA